MGTSIMPFSPSVLSIEFQYCGANSNAGYGQKVGNSLQIVLPKLVTDGLKIKQGDKLSLTVDENGEIRVKKPKTTKDS